MTDSKRWPLYFQYASLAGLMLILLTLRLPQTSYLWRELHNFGHTPIFGLIAWISTSIATRLLPNWTGRLGSYLVGGLATVLIGFAFEGFQIFAPGDADWVDILRNSAGIISFLFIKLALDRSRGGTTWLTWRRRALLIVTGLLILLISSAKLLLWSSAYLERENKFPTLADFENWPGQMFFIKEHATLEATPPPEAWIENQSSAAGLFIGFPGYEYPVIELDDPRPDWSDYSYFSFIAFSPEDTTIELSMTIEDHHHNFEYEDRFTRALKFKPGATRVEIDLEDVRGAPHNRQMDMASIARIKIFFYQPTDSTRLYIDDLTLR